MNDDYANDRSGSYGERDNPFTAEVMKDDENLVKAIISKAEVEIIVEHCWPLPAPTSPASCWHVASRADVRSACASHSVPAADE